MSFDVRFALNAVCPYFTMFPLEYPMRVLASSRLCTYRRAVLVDPYCGRGTALYAARLLGVAAYGVDIAPVAVAVARAKLADTNVDEVLKLFDELLAETQTSAVPKGDFWRLAFHLDTLRTVCRVRAGLPSRRCDAAAMLRAVMLGALHGPMAKTPEAASYFSNQMPRTFAAKPQYAIGYWRRKGDVAPNVDVRAIVRKRLQRVFRKPIPEARTGVADVRCADSRTAAAFARLKAKITHVVTSPPYYGLRTYSQDQWLREWFLGGSDTVDYGRAAGLDHSSPEAFSEELARVWNQIGDHASQRVRLYIRFGGIGSRKSPADQILRDSLRASRHPWRVLTRHRANSANFGKRQALQMQATNGPVEEHDYVVCLA